MEMNNKTCGCPGLKLGHNKTPGANGNTDPAAFNQSLAAATIQKRLSSSNYASQIHGLSHSTNGTFKLPGYETPRLDRLPTPPQTLFQKDQLLNMLQDFASHMYDAINTNGIHLPPSITLGVNNSGNIHVLGNHPDQAKIESLFGSQSALTQQLHQIAFTSNAQQLAALQPGFKNDFFHLPNNSVQQINFVYLRAVSLAPFSMTIEQSGNSDKSNPDTHPGMATQGQSISLSYIQMMISSAKGTAAQPATTQTQLPTPSTANTTPKVNARPGITYLPGHWKPGIYPSASDQNNTPIATDPKITLDDPVPVNTPHDEQQPRHKPPHVHKGHLKCVINR